MADKTKNRGFAFVEYESHRSAAVARRKCISSRLQLWGKNVAVDWAEPEPLVDDEILSKVNPNGARLVNSIFILSLLMIYFPPPI